MNTMKKLTYKIVRVTPEMAEIHARLNEPQIRKLVKKLQIELATN